MAQPSTRRIVTEAALTVSQAVQDATLANHKGRIESVEVLGGLSPGNTSDAAVRDLLLNSATETAKQIKGQYVGKGELAKNVRDYKLPADADDLPAIVAAHNANPAVFYPDGNYTPGGWDNALNTETNAAGPRFQSGRRFAGTTDARPTMWVHKYSNVARTTEKPEQWDNGAGYFALHKEGGSAPGIALTGFALNLNEEPSGIGGSIAVHGRARGHRATSGVWGAWFYAENRYFNDTTQAFDHIQETNGIEVNIVNKAPDWGWSQSAGSGSTRGLIVVSADGSNPITHGIYVGNNGVSAPNGKMHTGILLKGGGFMPSGANSATQVNNNEAIRIGGAATQADQYTGIRFHGGTLATGISFAETSFSNNAAILFADDHRIVVGPGPGSSTYLSFNKTTSTANFANLDIYRNGVKVVGTRNTGWGTASGTIDKAAYTTYTAPTISATYVQAEAQAAVNQSQAMSRRLGAVIQALTAHGLIGA